MSKMAEVDLSSADVGSDVSMIFTRLIFKNTIILFVNRSL